MDEYAALVEKGRVIFVTLNDEPFAVGEPRPLPQVVRDATDEIARIQTAVFENPGEQRGGGGFAMRAADHERTFAANEEFLQQFRQRTVTEFSFQHRLGFGIAARN